MNKKGGDVRKEATLARICIWTRSYQLGRLLRVTNVFIFKIQDRADCKQPLKFFGRTFRYNLIYFVPNLDEALPRYSGLK